MAITSELREDHIRVITMEHGKVNALPVADWFGVAEALAEAGRDRDTHVVVLRAEGRGFNAGVDIKEMQNTTGFDALLGANAGCYAAFKAVYECPVPVIAAVNGHCIGGGVGLVGNATSSSPPTTRCSACPRSIAEPSAPQRISRAWSRST